MEKTTEAKVEVLWMGNVILLVEEKSHGGVTSEKAKVPINSMHPPDVWWCSPLESKKKDKKVDDKK